MIQAECVPTACARECACVWGVAFLSVRGVARQEGQVAAAKERMGARVRSSFSFLLRRALTACARFSTHAPSTCAHAPATQRQSQAPSSPPTLSLCYAQESRESRKSRGCAHNSHAHQPGRRCSPGRRGGGAQRPGGQARGAGRGAACRGEAGKGGGGGREKREGERCWRAAALPSQPAGVPHIIFFFHSHPTDLRPGDPVPRLRQPAG